MRRRGGRALLSSGTLVQTAALDRGKQPLLPRRTIPNTVLTELSVSLSSPPGGFTSASASALTTRPGPFREATGGHSCVRTVPRSWPGREYWANVSDHQIRGPGPGGSQTETRHSTLTATCVRPRRLHWVPGSTSFGSHNAAPVLRRPEIQERYRFSRLLGFTSDPR
jgi:hypothetical protein